MNDCWRLKILMELFGSKEKITIFAALYNGGCSSVG